MPSADSNKPVEPAVGNENYVEAIIKEEIMLLTGLDAVIAKENWFVNKESKVYVSGKAAWKSKSFLQVLLIVIAVSA